MAIDASPPFGTEVKKTASATSKQRTSILAQSKWACQSLDFQRLHQQKTDHLFSTYHELTRIEDPL
jgi:hypothetical protein